MHDCTEDLFCHVLFSDMADYDEVMLRHPGAPILKAYYKNPLVEAV